MKTDRKFTVVFKDGTEKTGLTFDEADQAMKEGEESGNDWTNVYPEHTEYKMP